MARPVQTSRLQKASRGACAVLAPGPVGVLINNAGASSYGELLATARGPRVGRRRLRRAVRAPTEASVQLSVLSFQPRDALHERPDLRLRLGDARRVVPALGQGAEIMIFTCRPSDPARTPHPWRVNGIIAGRRAVTAETAVLLSRALRTTPVQWLNLPVAIDLWDAEQRLRERPRRSRAVASRHGRCTRSVHRLAWRARGEVERGRG